MHFATSFFGLVATAAVATAGEVTFWTLDNVERTIVFTGNPESAQIASVTVSNKKNTTVEFPEPWVGNFYAVQKGQADKPGMLGEVNFSGWNGLTYFDVSAIVDPADHNNVKQMWPAESREPMSGCEKFPCDNCYWVWDDVQTKVTSESHIITTLGEGATGLF